MSPKRENVMRISVENIPEAELEISAVRASGPGGQNVNKVSTAIHLRFDIVRSTLPTALKDRLLKMRDRRISDAGVVVIKAQNSRSQGKNKQEALVRLDELLKKGQVQHKVRRATKPSYSSVNKRLNKKTKQGQKKKLRRSSIDD
ncbi:MAG: ribosome-associated protein [Candidatus Azotimanducaceae bacterium]